MLVIISDLHLGDGTTAESIPASAFYLFAKRLRQDAHFASLHNGKYRPIEELDVLLMGDILDPLHSTKWLFPTLGNEEYVRMGSENLPRITEPGEKHYVRPWSNTSDSRFGSKLLEVTRAILDYNKEALEVLRKLSTGEFIEFDRIDRTGLRDIKSQERIHLKVHFHYMVGNHDWYYHLPGEAFDRIRQEIIDAMGLSNPSTPFPFDLRQPTSPFSWKTDEAPNIERLFREYKVFARHGDCYDSFNFNGANGRDCSTLGDAFTMEVCNRYPEELKRRSNLDQGIVDNLRQITNIRPALATPLWVTGQLRKLTLENKLKDTREAQLKGIWDELADNFLHLAFVREADKAFEFDMVDKMELAIKISKVVSLEMIDNLIFRLQRKKVQVRIVPLPAMLWKSLPSSINPRATSSMGTHITMRPSRSIMMILAAIRSISIRAHGILTSTWREKTQPRRSSSLIRRLPISPFTKTMNMTSVISKRGLVHMLDLLENSTCT